MTTPSNPYAGLIERLRREVPDAMRPYKSEATRPVNPDGPEAVEALSRLTRDVEECVEALRYAQVSLQGVTPPTMAGANISLRHVDATLTRLSRPTELGADPAFVASQSSPSVSTKGFNRGERKEAK